MDIFPGGSFPSELKTKGWWNKATFVYAEGEYEKMCTFYETKARELGFREPGLVDKAKEWGTGEFVHTEMCEVRHGSQDYLVILASNFGRFVEKYYEKHQLSLSNNAVSGKLVLFYKIHQEWTAATKKYMDPESDRVRAPYDAMRGVVGDLEQYTGTSRKILLSLYADMLGECSVLDEEEAAALRSVAAVLPKNPNNIPID